MLQRRECCSCVYGKRMRSCTGRVSWRAAHHNNLGVRGSDDNANRLRHRRQREGTGAGQEGHEYKRAHVHVTLAGSRCPIVVPFTVKLTRGCFLRDDVQPLHQRIIYSSSSTWLSLWLSISQGLQGNPRPEPEFHIVHHHLQSTLFVALRPGILADLAHCEGGVRECVAFAMLLAKLPKRHGG